MENRIGYLFLLGIIGIIIWAVLMGTEKMIRIIIGNYIIAATCFAFWESINTWSNQLLVTPDATFLKISYQSFANFLQNGQLTFIIILFVALVALVYTSSKINVSTMQWGNAEKLYYIFLIPLTLLSFIFALYIALMGEGIEVLTYIQKTIGGTFWFIQQFIENISFRMLAHGLIILIITSQLKLKINFSKKSTIIPEGIGDL